MILSWLKKHLSAVTKVFQYKFFKTLKLITGVEFKWQKYPELTRELDKERVIERLEVKGEEELKDNLYFFYYDPLVGIIKTFKFSL